MKLHYVIIVFVLNLTLLLSSCKKDFIQGNEGIWEEEVTTKASIYGQITDEQGKPIKGAEVSVKYNIFYTDSNGVFTFDNIQTTNQTIVKVRKQNYFNGYKTLTIVNNQQYEVFIKLIDKSTPSLIPSNIASTVITNGGAKIEFQANSFINKQNGSVYTGNVSVYSHWIDPSADDLMELTPGSLLAKDKNNNDKLLQTFGMIGVELYDENGQELQLADGYHAKLTFPIPTSLLGQAPQEIDLWYFDIHTGLWLEEGMATLLGSDYVTEVKHFTFWNCDYPQDVVRISMRFVDQANVPITHGKVKATNLLNNSTTYGFTNGNGIIDGSIPANANLKFELMTQPCNDVIYTRQITTSNSNINLGTISVSIPTNMTTTILGSIKDCYANPCPNSFAIITIQNQVFFTKASSNGNFAIAMLTCLPIQTIHVLVQNSTDMIFSEANYTITQGINSLGNLMACGNTPDEFVTWTSTLNGVTSNFSITNATGQITGGYAPEYGLSGVGSADEVQMIACSFTYNGSANINGNHYLRHFHDHVDYDSSANESTEYLFLTNNPIPVHLSNYGQIGGVIEGHFSGMVLGYHSPSRLVNCYFRCKREEWVP